MIKFLSIRWKITLLFLVVTLVTVGGLDLFLSHWASDYYIGVLRGNLVRESLFIGRQSFDFPGEKTGDVDAFAKRTARDLGCRVTIIRPDGRVIGESHHDPTTMELHNNRPEIKQALAEGMGWQIRYSDTLRQRMLYVATRIGDSAHPRGVSRLALGLAGVDQTRGMIHRVFLYAGLITLLFSMLGGIWLAGRIANPIQRITDAAERMSTGELTHRIATRDEPHDEIDHLAATINTMASELRAMMAELTAEKRRLRAILDKTDDGLLFVDHDGRIQIINPPAARLLGLDSSQTIGKTILEITFNPDLSQLIDRALRSGAPATLEIQLNRPEQAFLIVYAAPLENSEGVVGAVAVMHDMTKIKLAESMRRDFVANVSHELRTPLASVRAMAETIVLRAKKDSAIAEGFANKIISEVDRLTTLSEDLLDLARIEAGRRTINAMKFPLLETYGPLLNEMRRHALQKGITIGVEISPELEVTADEDAVYQILLNLVDNAIKYTQSGGEILVSACRVENNISISVKDTGIGIPTADQARIFERFYRVDKARSRVSGGTGLGLAIVKHLVESHGGKVSAESTPGNGSSFTFTLPDISDNNNLQQIVK